MITIDINDVKKFPGTICDLLERLENKEVIVILVSGEREKVKVLGVIGNLLVAVIGDRFKFVNCDCICAIIVNCPDLIDPTFGDHPKK